MPPCPRGAESEAHPDHFQLYSDPLSGYKWSHREELPGLSLKLSHREAQGLEAYLGFPGAPFQPGDSLRPMKLPGTGGHPEGRGPSPRPGGLSRSVQVQCLALLGQLCWATQAPWEGGSGPACLHSWCGTHALADKHLP